jgi:hypothetical protein
VDGLLPRQRIDMNIDELLQEAAEIKSVNSEEDFAHAYAMAESLAECTVDLSLSLPSESDKTETSLITEMGRINRLCGNYSQWKKAVESQAAKALRPHITERERQKALELSKAKDLEEFTAIRERLSKEEWNSPKRSTVTQGKAQD